MLRVPVSGRRAYAPRNGSRSIFYGLRTVPWNRAPGFGRQRAFADRKVDDAVIPPLPDSTSPAAPFAKPVISPENVPRTPPPPQHVQTSPPTTIPPSTRPAVTATGTVTGARGPPANPIQSHKTPRRRPRRFRRYLTWLLLISGLSYAGGIYYSLSSDNFHDFFTEYVPFGEDAVLYFEERAFRRRFPDGDSGPTRAYPQVRGENKITIPSRAGVSWKVAEDSGKSSDLATKGKHVSALVDSESKPPGNANTAKEEAPSPTPQQQPPSQPPRKEGSTPPTNPQSPDTKPAKETPSKGPQESVALLATTFIDPINVEGAQEPIVQELATLLNDIITVVNSDNASHKYASTMAKAKDDLIRIASDIATLKKKEEKNTEVKLQATHAEFDEAAKELVKRFEAQMKAQEARWKEEYESEREKLSQSYQGKLHGELESFRKASEQRLKNQLLEQVIELKKQFASEVQSLVETERSGRLSRLKELSADVEKLARMTSDYNTVVDANLKTQHLHVAVDAVSSRVEDANVPKPFVDELAALKQVAAEDPVVNAAIASLDPKSYQRGVPTTVQLIDRFRRLAGEVRKASLLPEEAGVASHAASLALSRVLFRKRGLAVGDDVESVLTRTGAFLEEGNLDEAAREMNGLRGWAKVLATDWLADVRKVLEVKQALEVISAETRLQSLLVD